MDLHISGVIKARMHRRQQRKQSYEKFNQIAYDFSRDTKLFAEQITEKLYPLVKRFLPKHLTNEVEKFVTFSMQGLNTAIIDRCIEEGILTEPKQWISGLGTYLVVKK